MQRNSHVQCVIPSGDILAEPITCSFGNVEYHTQTNLFIHSTSASLNKAYHSTGYLRPRCQRDAYPSSRMPRNRTLGFKAWCLQEATDAVNINQEAKHIGYRAILKQNAA